MIKKFKCTYCGSKRLIKELKQAAEIEQFKELIIFEQKHYYDTKEESILPLKIYYVCCGCGHIWNDADEIGNDNSLFDI